MRIMPQVFILAIIIATLIYFLLWRFFFKIGKGVNKEITKIQKEANREE